MRHILIARDGSLRWYDEPLVYSDEIVLVDEDYTMHPPIRVRRSFRCVGWGEEMRIWKEQ
jgi:hypothetical protein